MGLQILKISPAHLPVVICRGSMGLYPPSHECHFGHALLPLPYAHWTSAQLGLRSIPIGARYVCKKDLCYTRRVHQPARGRDPCTGRTARLAADTPCPV